jgi:pimeloyl-ACP methyl ester carboxylesterase
MATPLFFGETSRQLFGVYHPPIGSGHGDQAVLLCAPGPQEYMLTHWAHRRLAALLSGEGLAVLRFDYFGTGDSAGATDGGTLEIWQANIHVAMAKLRELSGAHRCSLVGHRLGATLAWRASREISERPRHLVLWDPVVRGTTYLRDLVVAEHAYDVSLLHFPRPSTPPTELFGYPFTTGQRNSTEPLDLLTDGLPVATRLHLYFGRETDEMRALVSRLSNEVKRFSFELVPEEGRAGSGNLLSKRVLEAIRVALSAEAG